MAVKDQEDQKENIMTAREKREVKELLQQAADLAVAGMGLDPSWPIWRRRMFWDSLDPQIRAFQDRVTALVGGCVAL